MSVFGEIGKLVFKTKQGSTLKLNKRGELVDPDTGAAVPYSANEVLDQDSLALYEKVKPGKIGSVNEVLALGADKVGKNNDAYSPASFMANAPEMTPDVAAMQVHRGRLGYLATRTGKAPVENEQEIARASQELLALHHMVRAETNPTVRDKLSEKVNDLSDYLNDLGLTVEQQTAALKSSEIQLDAPIYVSRADYGGHKDSSTYSTTVVDPAKLTSQPSTNTELDAAEHKVYKLDKGTKVIHTGNLADDNEVLVPGSILNSAQQANAGTLARSYAKGSPLFSVTSLGLGAAATQSEDANASLEQTPQASLQPIAQEVLPEQSLQAQEDPDAKMQELVTNMVKSGEMTMEDAYTIFKEETPESADKLLAPALQAYKQSLRAQGANPWAVAKEMESKFGQSMNIPQMFTPDMPPEAIIQAIEKVHAQPWAQAKEIGSLVSDNARIAVKEHSNQLASVIAAGLQDRGFEVRVQDDEDGSPIVEFQDKETGEWKVAESGIIRSLTGAAFQIAGGIGGFAAGARAAGALIPPIGLPGAAAKAGLTAIGTGLGAMAGSTVDHLAAASVLKQQLDTRELLARAAEDGVTDAVLGLGVDVVLRGGAKTYNGVKNAVTMARNAVDNYMLQGSLKELENITGLTKAERQALAEKLEDVSQDAIARNEARREIEAVLQTRPGMEILVSEASRLSKTAGFGMLKEIDARAKSVVDATNSMTADNISRVLVDELGAYQTSVKKGYEGVKMLGAREADSVGFQYNPNDLGLPALKQDMEGALANPNHVTRFDSLWAKLEGIGAIHDESGKIVDYGKNYGLAELLDTRRILTSFKSGNLDFGAINKVDRVIANIDTEVNKAINMMPNGQQWAEQFGKAKVEYSKMKALEGNIMYKALTKEGVSADDVVKSLSKYIKAEDGTFMKVMGKLPPAVRNNAEGAVIRNYANRYTLGDAQGFQAVDFPGLSRELAGVNFTTPGARDLKRVVDRLANVYKNDPALAREAGALQVPKDKTYLATSVAGRVDMALHTELFNYVSRYLPTQRGRTRRLAEAISSVLDNPLNAKAVDTLTKELPDDPQLKTKLHQLAISYAQRGQKEAYPKVPLYKVYKEGYSQSSASTKYGEGVQYYTSKDAANKAKGQGQIVEEVLVEPSRYATLEQASMVVGKKLTPAMLKQPRVVQQLKDHGYLGITDKDSVVEFKQ